LRRPWTQAQPQDPGVPGPFTKGHMRRASTGHRARPCAYVTLADKASPVRTNLICTTCAEPCVRAPSSARACRLAFDLVPRDHISGSSCHVKAGPLLLRAARRQRLTGRRGVPYSGGGGDDRTVSKKGARSLRMQTRHGPSLNKRIGGACS